jgi:hypothetical protein
MTLVKKKGRMLDSNEERMCMIAFDLMCGKGHLFECWFKDSASYEEQKEEGIINCPICNDTRIEKVLSPCMVKKKAGEGRGEIEPAKVLEAIQEYVDKHFEDVGGNFAKEALKIHYGEVKKRNIKGSATAHEEALLKQEGVSFFKIPTVKRLLN